MNYKPTAFLMFHRSPDISKKIVLAVVFACLFVVSSRHVVAQKDDDIAKSTSVFTAKPATTGTTAPRKTIRRLKAPKRPSAVSTKPIEATATAKKPKPAATKPTPAPASSESGAPSAGKWNGFVIGDEYSFLNLNAVSRPLPVWTREAQAAHADGLVQVGIAVDEKGSVISAKGRTGNKLLWESAEQAALQATFEPPKLYGKPARMIGFLVYCFGDHPDCN